MTEDEKKALFAEHRALHEVAAGLGRLQPELTEYLDVVTGVRYRIRRLAMASKPTPAAPAPAPLLEACEVFISRHGRTNPVCQYCGCGPDDCHKSDCAYSAFRHAVAHARKAAEPTAQTLCSGCGEPIPDDFVAPAFHKQWCPLAPVAPPSASKLDTEPPP